MVHRLARFLVGSSTLDFGGRVSKERPTSKCPGVSGIEFRLPVLIIQSGREFEHASIYAARVECFSNVKAISPKTRL